MNQLAVEVNHLSKKFSKGTKYQMLYGLKDISRLAIGLKPKFDQLRENEFWALSNISFKLKKGGTLGIIGSNGSGKSTLLKMIAGIYEPDIGWIRVKGQVGALIELGAGFHPELTGRENIYLNATILGLNKNQIDAKYDEIVEFAELEDFIEVPIKNYSSGMYARLGFSVIAHIRPEILLIDEVLSVGDIHFRQKSWEKIKELHQSDSTLILVAHNLMSVQTLCQDTLWIEKGQVIDYGPTDKVLARYYDFANQKALETNEDIDPTVRKGSGEIRVIQTKFLNHHHQPIKKVPWGNKFTVRVYYQVKKPVINESKTVFKIIIQEPSSTNLISFVKSYPNFSKLGKSGYVDFYFPNMYFAPKTYVIHAAIVHEDHHFHIYDYWAKTGGRIEVVHSSYTKDRGLIGNMEAIIPYQTKIVVSSE